MENKVGDAGQGGGWLGGRVSNYSPCCAASALWQWLVSNGQGAARRGKRGEARESRVSGGESR